MLSSLRSLHPLSLIVVLLLLEEIALAAKALDGAEVIQVDHLLEVLAAAIAVEGVHGAANVHI